MNQPAATLLLVDDDEMNRDAFSRRLRRAGYTVLTAESGLEALRIVAAQRVDAVLLDVMMPGMSGLETLKQLRKTRSVADLPVIMVTAKDGSDDVVDALGLGANDYVTKPIDFAVATARIRAQVTARRADPLTGLPNRVLFMERLSRLLVRTREPNARPFSVVFLDVDRFKLVNDSLGHAAGDELLLEIAKRLEASLRPNDLVSPHGDGHTLARIGGDEFTILLEGVGDEAQARAIAERLRIAVARPIRLQNREIVTSISIGIVVSADRYERAEDMVRDADTAMYRAKELGKARCEIFDTSMLLAAQERLQLESELRHALERDELEVYYQPIVSLVDTDLCGFEALLRWNHPRHGLMSAADFIVTAEETGLIVPIGRWVLREACRQMVAWQADTPSAARLAISVNLSAIQILQPDLVNEVRGILRETGMDPERVKLEITEGVVLENTEMVARVLESLRALGVQLGLDDFGMGYSGLSYLHLFPFQTIKIDRTFVSGMHDQGNTEIIRAIVSMAAGLQMNVTAEGVETLAQLQQLKELACEYGQGFYFRQPLSTEDARRMLRQDEWAAYLQTATA
jgi:diguanylate cyclase (GGDEF)-like protein